MERCGAGLKVARALLLAGVGFVLAGCKDSAVVEKEEVKSPDGYWTARMEIEQLGGPGTAGLLTHVYLVRTKSGGDPIEILLLSEESVSSGEVQMHWQNNQHLEVSRVPDSKIEFQAVKCAGVDISLH